MAGIPPERQAVGPWLRSFFSLAGLLVLSTTAYSQSTVVSGSNGVTATYQILDQQRVYFGQHSVTYNRITPPVFAAPVSTPAPVPPPQPAYDSWNLMLCGATIYDGQYTVVQRLDGTDGLTVISNIDFNYLTSSEGFVAGDTFYEMLFALDNESTATADSVTAGWLAQAHTELTGTSPGYIIVSGTASPDDLLALDGLHLYFGANRQQLVSAYQENQARYQAALREQALHPGARPDTVINYWPIKSGVYLTGSGQ